jgi:hypothetical protein
MKTAYELAMERLNKQSPAINLTDEQKAALAEIDSKIDAKIAERELTLNAEIEKARENGDYDAIADLDQQLTDDKNKLEADREEKKNAIRNAG